MHMLMVIVGGAVLLGVFLLFGKLWGGEAAALAWAAKVFIPVWLVVFIANLWVGVSHAGYRARGTANPAARLPGAGSAGRPSDLEAGMTPVRIRSR